MIPVTLVPMTAEMVVVPVPVPELVMVPALLSGVAETVKAPELLALKVTLPVPVMPVTALDIVNRDVPVDVNTFSVPLVVVIAPLIVRAEVLLA